MKRDELLKMVAYIAIVTGVFTLSSLAGLTTSQVLSVTIFSSFVAGSLFYWQFRNAFALIGLTFLLALGILDIAHLLEFARLDIILFLVGMMIIIIFLEEKKFFDWLISKIIAPFQEKPVTMIFIIFVLATVMAALVDEVTSILFMTVILLKVLKHYKVEGLRVLPFVMFLVFTTNIGSSALPVGNPVGVIIAFAADYTFNDFVRWVLPIAVVSSLLVTVLGVVYLKRATSFHVFTHDNTKLQEVPFDSGIKLSIILFISVIAGLVLHSRIEELLGLETNTLLLGVPLIVAGIVLLISRSNAQAIVSKVDWWTLLYFTLLFASVGTLAYTGVTDVLANWISTGVGGNLFMAMLVLGLVVSFLTAFMDNVLAVATMVPVVEALGQLGLQTMPLWWITLIGGTYCGNATVIGSTANIVAAGMMEKKSYGSFSQKHWMMLGVPISLITFFLAFFLLWIQVPLMPP